MKLTMLTTCVVGGDNLRKLQFMIECLAASQAEAPNVTFCLVLLLQQPDADPAGVARLPRPNFLVRLSSEQTLSLSAARNRLLRHALAEGLIDDDCVVAFPDDDSWYPPGTVAGITRLFDAEPALDLFFCRYGPKAEGFDASNSLARPAEAADVVRQCSSNTIFLRGRMVSQIGAFDENLGVGALYGGAEDLDYGTRAYLLARTALFLDAEIVGHRAKLKEHRGRYFRGSYLVLRRNALKKGGILYEYLRKSLIGLLLLAGGQIGLKDFRRQRDREKAPSSLRTEIAA